MVTEREPMFLDCGSGYITEILFASFGTPNGECGGFGVNNSCHASTSIPIVESMCLGQSSCTIVPTDSVFTDPCYGTLKRLYVQAQCSNDETYSLTATIPANTQGTIAVSKLAFSNVVIQEGGDVVWKNGAYVPGVPGINSATDNGQAIVFSTGSGVYNFQVSGQPGIVICGQVNEVSYNI
jgi:hypothetical protein